MRLAEGWPGFEVMLKCTAIISSTPRLMSILLIDEHPLMREAVASLIQGLSRASKVIQIDSPGDAHGAVDSDEVLELICLELHQADGEGLTALRDLKHEFPDTPVVVLTSATEKNLAELSMDAGASAYVHKSASSAEIANVLREFLPSDAAPVLPPGAEKLSRRQKQLLSLLDRGMSNRDIAESLQISEHTVKVHLWRLFRRLNVKSRSQASHLARTQGLL
jgi:DNA-binding NarL/FixJ family response regulator